MAISGLVARGAQQSLEELLERQLLQEQLAAQTEARSASGERENRRLDLSERQFKADQDALERQLTQRESEQSTKQERGRFEATARQNMSELINDPTQLAAFSMASGVDVPAGVRDLTEPKTVNLTRVRTIGPGGQPIEKGVTDEELAAGVPSYQAPRAPASSGERPMTPGQKFNATRALRNDFTRESQAAREVQNQFRLMQSALDAARAGDLAAGSQGVLVTFQKILDPTSVVRESEYARSASGQSLLSRIEGAADKLAQGGAGVPVGELERFVALAEQFAQNQARAAGEAKTQIDAIAEEFGMDPALITREMGGEPAAADDEGGTVRLMAPNGQVREVPAADAERYIAAGAKRVP